MHEARTSTVNWRITNVEVAATMAAETMARSGVDGAVSGDISKLRNDVLKQAIASLAAFIGTVNYSARSRTRPRSLQSAQRGRGGGAANARRRSRTCSRATTRSSTCAGWTRRSRTRTRSRRRTA